jgi:hypothetical protein
VCLFASLLQRAVVKVTETEILFKEPVVDIDHGKCKGHKITITDHYGMMFTMEHKPAPAAVFIA